ncbi:hypothetical protein Tco_1493450, partial [Tanacetum coccineum]
SGYQQKDRKPSQNDKTEHGMEKTVQNQGQSPKMPKSESIQKNQHDPWQRPFALVKGIRSGSVLGLLYKCTLSANHGHLIIQMVSQVFLTPS